MIRTVQANQFRFPKRLPGWHPSRNHESSQVSFSATWLLKTFCCIDNNLWPIHQHAQLEHSTWAICYVSSCKKEFQLLNLFNAYLGTLFTSWLRQRYNSCVDLTRLPVFILHFHCRFFLYFFSLIWLLFETSLVHFLTSLLHLEFAFVSACIHVLCLLLIIFFF